MLSSYCTLMAIKTGNESGGGGGGDKTNFLTTIAVENAEPVISAS